MTSLPAFFTTYQDTVNRALDRFVPSPDSRDSSSRTIPRPVIEAMRYTLLAPSKRVRAVLVMLAADLCGTDSRAVPAACAIEAVHASTTPGHELAYWAVLTGVFITSLYSFRLLFVVFHGKERMDHHTKEHLHETPWVVTGPLIALAIPSVIIGWLTIGPVLFGDYFGGSIVNLSSISGFIGQPFVHMGYNAAKGAIRLLTKSAAVQYAKDGIRVNSVHPGVMPPMRTSVTSGDPALRAQLLATIPMGRAGTPEEAAYAILFLASDEASYITGTELVVDGGFLAM